MADRDFLERVFHKLLLNFTWWVNRKDREGHNVFQGGFLGLDNIGVFDRSAPLPTGGHLEQADGTAWMGMYCLNMLAIALELARENPAYEDVATKFFEHFLYIAERDEQHRRQGRSRCGTTRTSSSTTCCHLPDGESQPLQGALAGRPDPAARRRDDRAGRCSSGCPTSARGSSGSWSIAPTWPAWSRAGTSRALGERRLLALVRGHRMKRLLQRMLDPSEFLSDYGVRVAQQVPPATTRTRWTLDGAALRGRATSRPSRAPGCSAATPTGAARSGSRSTTC